VDENADRAEAIGMKYISDYYKTVIKHYEFMDTHLHGLKGYEFYSGISKYLTKRGVDGASEDFAKLMPWGTPEQVYDKLMYIRTLIGQAGVMGHFSYANMPYDMAEKSLKLFAKEVMPELQKVPAESPAYADAETA
jgi:hypothetical protein